MIAQRLLKDVFVFVFVFKASLIDP
jgi:hypothetical protein